jgi:hypothetical protein
MPCKKEDHPDFLIFYYSDRNTVTSHTSQTYYKSFVPSSIHVINCKRK